jgi:hypothetical protein
MVMEDQLHGLHHALEARLCTAAAIGAWSGCNNDDAQDEERADLYMPEQEELVHNHHGAHQKVRFPPLPLCSSRR